jgi:hypothetical protein
MFGDKVMIQNKTNMAASTAPPSAADVTAVVVNTYHQGHSVCRCLPRNTTIGGDNRHTDTRIATNIPKFFDADSKCPNLTRRQARTKITAAVTDALKKRLLVLMNFEILAPPNRIYWDELIDQS